MPNRRPRLMEGRGDLTLGERASDGKLAAQNAVANVLVRVLGERPPPGVLRSLAGGADGGVGASLLIHRVPGSTTSGTQAVNLPRLAFVPIGPMGLNFSGSTERFLIFAPRAAWIRWSAATRASVRGT